MHYLAYFESSIGAPFINRRFIVKEMFNTDSLFEYLSSPEGMNKIVVWIIIVGAINAIFITYSVRATYGMAKKEREKQRIQQAKIDKLYPKKK